MIRGLEATAAYRVGSLDGSDHDDDRGGLMDRQAALATIEFWFDHSFDRGLVADPIGRLPEREREIVGLRMPFVR